MGGLKLQDEDLRDYILMKDVYHCTPNELEKQPAEILNLHYSIYLIEQEARLKANKKITKNNASK